MTTNKKHDIDLSNLLKDIDAPETNDLVKKLNSITPKQNKNTNSNKKTKTDEITNKIKLEVVKEIKEKINPTKLMKTHKNITHNEVDDDSEEVENNNNDSEEEVENNNNDNNDSEEEVENNNNDNNDSEEEVENNNNDNNNNSEEEVEEYNNNNNDSEEEYNNNNNDSEEEVENDNNDNNDSEEEVENNNNDSEEEKDESELMVDDIDDDDYSDDEDDEVKLTQSIQKMVKIDKLLIDKLIKKVMNDAMIFSKVCGNKKVSEKDIISSLNINYFKIEGNINYKQIDKSVNRTHEYRFIKKYITNKSYMHWSTNSIRILYYFYIFLL